MKRALTLVIALLVLWASPAVFGQEDDEDDLLEDTTATTTEAVQTSWLSQCKSESGGEIKSENRAFEDDNDSSTADYGIGIYARLDHQFKCSPVFTSVRAVSRVDSVDPERDVVYLEEAWVGVRFWRMYLKAGSQLFNWTATEAFQPADIMNSRNFDSNLENAEKFGEPSISLEIEIPFGSITGYYMPYYIDPKFPGNRSRLSFISIPANFSAGEALKVDHDGQLSSDDYGHQAAVLWRISVGAFDAGIHALEQVSRNFALPVLDPTTNSVSALFPRLRQAGGQLQLVTGPLINKVELAYRKYREFDQSIKSRYFAVSGAGAQALQNIPEHSIVALGLEYGFDLQGGSELTLLLEGQHVFGLNRNEREAIEIFQADVLFGIRYAANDVLDKQFLISALADVERLADGGKYQQILINSNYSQRINEEWSFQMGVRRTIAPQQGASPIGLEALDDANQYFFNLSRFF